MEKKICNMTIIVKVDEIFPISEFRSQKKNKQRTATKTQCAIEQSFLV